MVHRSAADGCWTYTGFRDAKGYGKVGWRRRVVSAHRLAWELTHGPIPNGLWACHRCDNPSCVRPDHIFLGTPQDNTLDSVRKNRWHRPQSENNSLKRNPPRGEKNVKAKLTEAQVREIRAHHSAGVSQCELGRRYGVSQPAIRYIVIGKHWRHIQ